MKHCTVTGKQGCPNTMLMSDIGAISAPVFPPLHKKTVSDYTI